MAWLMPDDPTVIGLVTAGLAEVKDAVTQLSRDLHGTLNSLPNDYVPRRELERRLDEFSIDIGAERAAREATVKTMVEQAEKASLERANHRRWIVGLAVGTAMSALGLVTGVILQLT